MTTDCTPEKDGEVKRVPMIAPGMMTLEILLLQRRSGCWVLLVLHASLCSCCHGSASQHSKVQLWSYVLLQSGQILGLIFLTIVQVSPAHKDQTMVPFTKSSVCFGAMKFEPLYHVAQHDTVT